MNVIDLRWRNSCLLNGRWCRPLPGWQHAGGL